MTEVYFMRLHICQFWRSRSSVPRGLATGYCLYCSNFWSIPR